MVLGSAICRMQPLQDLSGACCVWIALRLVVSTEMELRLAGQVGNFRVEPPGLFRGRGEHPKMGKFKRRIYPRDITINIGLFPSHSIFIRRILHFLIRMGVSAGRTCGLHSTGAFKQTRSKNCIEWSIFALGACEFSNNQIWTWAL